MIFIARTRTKKEDKAEALGRILKIAVVLFFWASVVQAQDEVSERSSARVMAMLLAQLASRADPVANIYLNRQRAEGLSSLLAQPMSPGKELNMRVRIARERVRAGDTRGGIAELEYALDAVEAGQVPANEGFVFMLHDQLGIAWLRLGEQENCLRNHSTNSCLLPIQGDGVHVLPEGSRRAIEHYTINLQNVRKTWERDGC